MTEADILAGCLRQEPAAQRELYARWSDRIYRLLLRFTHNADDAADLLQETFVRVFQNLERFRGGSSLGTWIYRIAVNEARQHFRRRNRHDEILRQVVAPPPEARTGDQEAAALRMDVMAAVAQLPEEERALILLRYFEDLDYARMAEVLEKPPGTIASGLNRARRLLVEILGSGMEPAARVVKAGPGRRI
ncbi:MAG: sigma-70 family RNA polymerase sigma factor [Phycisphaerae bacterium]